MIDVLPVNMRMFEPSLQRMAIHEMRKMAAA
jgi:hypothetical protein